ncbi:hypothetical protein GLW08_16875 [Pontibacillus yanchengensis]|uniref:Uncharacterized protein n=3 Tax=Pontibacillus yanchengensis TaxID=462910 RepID=A0ACC7VLE0_9BACI|nr:hypothetical protein [Pontibacillus yanchengensis]MYL32615.1 hypothetical protein [Pontibacillus yanchengensis]MYL55009.1 hypothetical protein [Pontibacillus yanchengensis]
MDHKKSILTHMVEIKNQLDRGELSEPDLVNREDTLVIFTHSSMIEGRVILFQNNETNTFLEYGLEALEEEIEQLPDDMNALNIAAPIHIIDAQITPLSNPEILTVLSEMVLYSD